jgi:uncharacterized protein YjbJ (UPF0337 family)
MYTLADPIVQIGNATGSQEWVNSGKKTHAEGEGEQKAAQAKAYAEGLTDQVGTEMYTSMTAMYADLSLMSFSSRLEVTKTV